MSIGISHLKPEIGCPGPGNARQSFLNPRGHSDFPRVPGSILGRRQDSAQDIDLVLLDPGTPEEAAQARQQEPRP